MSALLMQRGTPFNVVICRIALGAFPIASILYVPLLVPIKFWVCGLGYMASFEKAYLLCRDRQ